MQAPTRSRHNTHISAHRLGCNEHNLLIFQFLASFHELTTISTSFVNLISDNSIVFNNVSDTSQIKQKLDKINVTYAELNDCNSKYCSPEY